MEQQHDSRKDEALHIIRDNVFDAPAHRSAQQLQRRISPLIKGTTDRLDELDIVVGKRDSSVMVRNLIRHCIQYAIRLSSMEDDLTNQMDVLQLRDPTVMDRLLRIFNVMHDAGMLKKKYTGMVRNLPLLRSDAFINRLNRIITLYDSTSLKDLFKIFQGMTALNGAMEDWIQTRTRGSIQRGQALRSNDTRDMLEDIERAMRHFRDSPSIHDWLRDQFRIVRSHRRILDRSITSLQQQQQIKHRD